MFSKSRILIVDDSPSLIKSLNETLRDEYHVSAATSGHEALEIVHTNPPDLILLDIAMPDMSGYDVCRTLKSNPLTCDIPILFVTILNQTEDETLGLELGAVDYIIKPISPPIVRARVRNHLRLKMHQDHLEDMVRDRTRQLLITQDVTIQSLATLAEFRDPGTGFHIRRTQEYIRILAEGLTDHPLYRYIFTPENIELLCKSAALHDIGKVGIRDQILMKPAKLNDEEMEEMKRHPWLGYSAIRASGKVLGENSFLTFAQEIAYTHHESWDGSGYPRGLKGADIPISGRLMILADIYDALVSKRPYKPAFSHADSVQMILDERNKFDPEVLELFLDRNVEFERITQTFCDF